jgi:hypothetical protein
VALFVASAPGCGGAGDCESACNAQKKGGCNSAVSNCATFCQETQKAAEAAGCGSEFDTASSCIAGAKDACNPGTTCASEENKYAACVGKK